MGTILCEHCILMYIHIQIHPTTGTCALYMYIQFRSITGTRVLYVFTHTYVKPPTRRQRTRMDAACVRAMYVYTYICKTALWALCHMSTKF